MGFLSPLFWLGVAALAAPILVHLVRRTRARRVEFPALVFVRQVPQRTIRRRTLQNLLLLLLRCLAILLIVLAFTRPFFSGSGAKENVSSTATVILIDNSLSMRRDQLFAEARRRAESTIDNARAGDQLGLVSFGKRYEVISRFTTDKNNLRLSLESISPGWEGTDYEQALRGAESLFRELQTDGPKQIVLISDFQAVGWSPANATFKLSSDIQLMTLDVAGDNPPPNVAVTKVEARAVVFGQKYLDNIAVQINNFAETPRDHVQIDFQMNDQTVEKRDISLDALDSRVVEFTGFNLAEGANRCAIDINAGDFALDNRFYFIVKREPQAKALIVESASRDRGDSVYLLSALNMNDDLPFTFTLKTTGTVDPASIAGYSLIILNDAGSLSSALGENLSKFVEAGGQLIVSTGPRTDPGSINSSLGRVLPAVLREAQMKQGETVAISDVKFDHPIFEVFRQGGRLTAAHIQGYLRTEPRVNAAVLARYEDGNPALIESSAGKGRVLLFTSSLGTTWNDLPLTPLYLPFVHQMVRYTGGQDQSSWYALGQTFAVVREPQGSAPAVDTPSGTRLIENRVTPEGTLLVTGREPGFYRLRYSTQPGFIAVDVDGSEGDFRKLNFAEFVAGVSGGSGNLEDSQANLKSSKEELEARQRIWWPLLLVALVLLLTESVLAYRTKVVRMIGS